MFVADSVLDLDDQAIVDAEVLEQEVAGVELEPAPAPRAPKKPGTSFKPGHRVPQPATAKATGERPWWATTDVQGFTEHAKNEQERMARSKEAKRIDGRIND